MSASSDLQDVLGFQLEAGKKEYVDQLLEAALGQIAAGKGELGFVVTGSLNGKTFGRQSTVTAVQMARACVEAMRDFHGYGPITFLDFKRTVPDGDGGRGNEESWP
ncbi:MAG: hypothetical protein ABSE62_05020 [Chthoniobacteraceae bacterium]|jgi:hypothetical protein